MLLKVSVPSRQLFKQDCGMQLYLQLVNQYCDGVKLVARVLIGHVCLWKESKIKADLPGFEETWGRGWWWVERDSG